MGPLSSGFSDHCVARRGNTIVPHYSRESETFRRPCAGFVSVVHAIVRLRRNQISAVPLS